METDGKEEYSKYVDGKVNEGKSKTEEFDHLQSSSIIMAIFAVQCKNYLIFAKDL